MSLPSLVFHTTFTVSELKNKYSSLTGVGPPALESSVGVSKFYAPTDFKHKFNKTKIENSLPIRYNLGSS